jgi:HEAT repeat protein
VVFGYTTLENLPASLVPKPADVTATVSCALAQGQYESLHIGVYALDDGITAIKATVDCDLPVTVYHRIDPDTKAKLGVAPYEEIATWMGAEVYLQKGGVTASLAKGSSTGFWLTFHAEAQARAGVHRGKIRIEVAGRAATELELLVTVRPFTLEAPRAAFGMYYREDMLPARLGSWGLSDTAALAIYRDMAAHGQNSVSFYNMGDFKQLPPKASLPVTRTLALAQQAGLTHPAVPSMAMQANLISDFNPGGLSDAQMKAASEWLRTEERQRGWPEIMMYGWDEAPYPAPGLRETYAPLRKYPIRLCAAMNATGAYGYGDVHDVWIVMGGDITPEMQAEAKRLGAQVWTYSYRILREGWSPLRQRYYAGLYTWALGLGGNYVWAYSHGHHSHAWWEPDSEEPMPITGWEARREGIDDYRYLQTLEDAINAAPDNPTAAQAAAWVSALRERLRPIDPHKAEAGKPLAIDEYETIRAAASAFIETLGTVPAGRIEPLPVTYLKDEAAAFRGTSVEACQAGLRNADVATRRAAATALFEMGRQAAPAIPELARALDDPEVRIPALRAIEAAGPDGYPALPGIAKLLADPDDFLRLSATFPLVGLARPASWTDELKGYDPADVSPRAPEFVPLLRQALADRFPQVADAAAFGLFYCGSAASEALPFAIEVLEKQNDVATKIIAGLGPAAASAVPALLKRVEAAKGQDPYNCQALAAIGPAAAAAVSLLETYRTPDNPYLADVCYALFCIRGEEKDLTTLVEMIGQENLPAGSGEWQAAARFLGALGGKAAPVAERLRQRLSLLDREPTVRQQIEKTGLKRITENAAPLRLLPR